MNFIRAMLLVLTVALVPGGLILLAPLAVRWHRWFVENRKRVRQPAALEVAPENCQIRA